MRRSGGVYINVQQPHAAHVYNVHMAGTDKSDQKRQAYAVGRLSKMWKYLLWFFVNSCIVNSWIIYKKVTTVQLPKQYVQLHFHHDLLNSLTAGFSSQKLCVHHDPLRITVPSDYRNVHMTTKWPHVCKLHWRYFGKKHETICGYKACSLKCGLKCHSKVHEWH